MAETISGTVTEITAEGDLLTDISSEQLANVPRDARTQITVDDEHETFGLFGSQHDQPAFTLIGIHDEGQCLRLHLVGDSASAMLGVRKGASVQLKW